MANIIPSSNRISFNENNMERQYFYLPYPVTQHILWNANAEVLNKLYQTCKFFYKKRPYCIVDEMEIDQRKQLSMMINNAEFELNAVTNMDMIDKIWITKNLYLRKYDIALLSKIVRCDAVAVGLGPEWELSMKDFITLTQSGNVKTWDSYYSNIIDENGKLISPEELLFHLPNADHVCATVHHHIHPNPVNVASTPRKTKIKILCLDFDYPFNANVFFDLLKETLAPEAVIFFRLGGEDAVENFQAEMDSKLVSWIPQNETPHIYISIKLI